MNVKLFQKVLNAKTIFATWLVAIVLLPAMFPPSANAQDQDDPPGRVARLGYIEGSVSFQPAGESDWVEAVANRPMTTGDKIWADQNSRAEVELGSASIQKFFCSVSLAALGASSVMGLPSQVPV